MYENNDKKIVAVLNGKIETAKLFNAITHTISGLACKIGEKDLEIVDYNFKDNSKPSNISKYPIIILKAKNGNQLKTLREKASEAGLFHNSFTGEMIGASSDEQIKQNIEADEPQFWTTAIFGNSEEINLLTKKFSLFKG